MLLRKEIRLEEILVRMLARKAHQSLPDLIRAVGSGGYKFSAKAFYKELRKLQHLGVIVKVEKHYSLSLSWYGDLLDFAGQIKRTYLQKDYVKSLLPSEGQRVQWHFSSMLHLNDFWNQLMLVLTGLDCVDSFYSWIPHPWYVLLAGEKELRQNKNMGRYTKPAYYIIGGESYLDRLVEKVYRRPGLVHSFAESVFENIRREYIYVLGPYILRVRLSKALASELDYFYGRISSPRQTEMVALWRLLQNSHRASLSVENNKKRSEKLVGKFGEHFHIRA